MRIRRFPATLILALLSSPLTRAEPLYSVSFGALVDDAGNDTYNVDGLIVPNGYVTLAAGAGQAHTDGRYSNLNGDALRASVDVHNDLIGARASYSQWKDSSSYESRTGRLTLHLTIDALQFALIGEQRDFDIGYTVLTPSGPADRNFRFDGTGFGGSVNWFGPRWGTYLEGVGYDYGSDLQRLIAFSGSPFVERFPAIEALVGSILVQAESALDYQFSVGVSHQFSSSNLGLDLFAAKGAIDGVESRSVSANYSFEVSRVFDIELTFGVNDTEGFDTAIFGGVGFTVHN